MTHTLAMPARYELFGVREDGVQIYREFSNKTGGAGLLPDAIHSPILLEYRNGKWRNVGTVDTSIDDPLGLMNVIENTRKNNREIERGHQINRKKIDARKKVFPINLLLAAAFFAASIPLGIEAQNATLKAMDDPDVIQRAEKRSWNQARDEIAEDTKKKIKSLEIQGTSPVTFTDDKKDILERKNQLLKKNIKSEASRTHDWDDAEDAIMTLGIYFSILAGLSLTQIFTAKRRNKKLDQLAKENIEIFEKAKTAFGQLPPTNPRSPTHLKNSP